MKPTHIYALVDPRTGFVRYVGKTIKTIAERLATHICLARRTHTHSARWICGILDAGLKPEAIHIETVTDDWREAEQYWIAQFRSFGFPLTNHTSGGDGLSSYKHKEDSRAKMAASQKRRYESAPNPLKGRKRPPEVIAKMRQTKLEKYPPKPKIAKPPRNRLDVSEETRRKISEANKGKPKPPRTPEHSAKIAASARGRVQSAESRAKKSAALKKYCESPEGRLRRSEVVKARLAKANNQPKTFPE